MKSNFVADINTEWQNQKFTDFSLYEIWQKARIQTSIEFDLIYDPVGLLTLLENRNIFKNEVLYIHQGGVLGNISQLQRYKYKFPNLNF